MNSKLGMTLAFVTVLIGAVVINGCVIKPEQAKVIAEQTGLFSAVGWIAADNPSDEQIAAVVGLLSVIETKAADVVAGKTYTEVVYPELVKVINAKVEAQYQPLARAASLSLLGGLDMLFAVHPEWKEDQDMAISIVNAFVAGAQRGFSLDKDHPAMVQARKTAALRAAALR